MDLKYISTALTRLFITVCALLVIFTLVYHSADLGKAKMTTAVAEAVTTERLITGEGYFFRKETVLPFEGTGVCYSALSASENVAYMDKVATVYPIGSDVAALKGYDRTIALLSEASAGKDLASVTAELKKLSAELRADSADGAVSNLLAKTEQLNVLLNQSSTLSGGASALKAELTRLKEERNALLGSFGKGTGSILASAAGEYYPDCDGYEQIFSAEKIESLTLSSFKELTAAQPQTVSNAGKIVTNSYWYLVTVADTTELLNTTVGKAYSVYIGERAEKFTLTLDRVESNAAGESLLIFGCRITPQQLFDRCEKISIVAETASGIRVPTAAIRVLRNEEGVDTVGVYVREGNYLRFKTAVIFAEQEGSYIVKTAADIERENAASSENGETATSEPLYPYLAVNDVIVTAGKDLKEGYFR